MKRLTNEQSIAYEALGQYLKDFHEEKIKEVNNSPGRMLKTALLVIEMQDEQIALHNAYMQQRADFGDLEPDEPIPCSVSKNGEEPFVEYEPGEGPEVHSFQGDTEDD